MTTMHARSCGCSDCKHGITPREQRMSLVMRKKRKKRPQTSNKLEARGYYQALKAINDMEKEFLAKIG